MQSRSATPAPLDHIDDVLKSTSGWDRNDTNDLGRRDPSLANQRVDDVCRVASFFSRGATESSRSRKTWSAEARPPS